MSVLQCKVRVSFPSRGCIDRLRAQHVSAVISPAPPAAFLASLYSRDVQLPIESSPLYDRIEARKSALEARQARKLGKSQVEAGLRSNVS